MPALIPPGAGRGLPSVSTDQVAAFVELVRQGNIRRAAKVLLLTEQGVRTRLLALEARLGVELYRKSRGMRQATPLTDAGRRFLPHAAAFLARARELAELAATGRRTEELNVAASQYLTLYLLIRAVRRFRVEHPDTHVRLSTMAERDVEAALLENPDLTLGVAAPYDPSPELEYRHLFSLSWHLIAPPRHPLLRASGLDLRAIARYPLILFERGSTGRQHVMEAFQARSLAPQVVMETTHTGVIVRMVEAGLGLSIVPLLPNGEVTRGRRVASRALGGVVRPIQSGILFRRGQPLSATARKFMELIRREGRAYESR